MANYYDRILEDFESSESESIYDEGILDEGILDEGVYDEGIYDEARKGRLNRPVKVSPALRKPSNFGQNVSRSPSQGNGHANMVSKTELKNSLNSISSQVNELKKSSLNLAASIKRLDDGYEKVVKSIAKKDRLQDNMMSSGTMMSMLGTLVNKPTLNTAALRIKAGATPEGRPAEPDTIELVPGQDPIQVDLMKTLLFTMMPAMMSGSSGNDNNMMMPLMMVLLLNKPATGTATASNDNTTLLMLPMMMMMMNKK